MGSRFQRSMARMPCQDLHFWARDMDIELLTLPNLGVESLEAELGVSNPYILQQTITALQQSGPRESRFGLVHGFGTCRPRNRSRGVWSTITVWGQGLYRGFSRAR